jgi:hypothetical protein
MVVVMTFTKSFLLLSILVTASFDALAAEVYKTVDENGNIVFSDKPSADAETIKVQPNVVDVNIPKMPEPAVQEKPRTQTSTQSREVEQEMIGYGTAMAATFAEEYAPRPMVKVLTVPDHGQHLLAVEPVVADKS